MLPILIECPCCSGECRFEVWTGYDPRDGSPTGYYETCDECKGTGGIEIEPEPITLDDLDKMCFP